MSNYVIESKGWVTLYFDHSVYDTDEFRAWMRAHWDKGEKIYRWPVMDSTDYGMHFMYRFEDAQIAEMCKLKFETIDNNR